MDFHNLCYNINVDAIRAKIPPLPKLPALPQIKLPKCMEKLKSCRYFRKARNDNQRTESKRTAHPRQVNETFTTLQRSEYVQHTPTHISTISSLIYQRDSNYNFNEHDELTTYRRAGSIDDYPTPLAQRQDPNAKHLSTMTRDSVEPPQPLPSPALETTSQNTKLSLSERLQKTYKDLSEFKLRNLFNKETTVRKDNIGVDYYVKRYESDRRRENIEQEDRDMKIADNYNFKFKTPRKRGEESFEESSDEEKIPPKRPIRSVSEHSGDESGMEQTPPHRKLGTATTKISKLRKTSLNVSQDGFYEDDNEQQLHRNPCQVIPNESSVFKIKNKAAKREQVHPDKKDKPVELKSDKEDNDSRDSTSGSKPLGVIKQNLKLLQKSIKLPTSHNTNTAKPSESFDDSTDKEHQPKLSKTQKISERLKRMRSQGSAEAYSSENEENPSKLNRADVTAKLQKLKESFQRTCPETANTEEANASRKSGDSIMTKLKNIRISKKDSDDPDDDEQHRTTSKESLAARAKLQLEKGVVLASQVPQRTLKKISESKRYFQRSQTETRVEKTPERHEQHDPIRSNKDHIRDSGEDEDYVSKQEYFKAMSENEEQIVAHSSSVAWTTKPIFNDSIDFVNDADGVSYTPRILIHQDNSDEFDSTLMIAVTRSRTQSPSPIITAALPPESVKVCLKRKRQQQEQNSECKLTPNKEDISNFLNESTAQTEFNVDDVRRKLKRQSLDSSRLETASWTIDKPNKADFRYSSVVELSVPTTDQESDAWNMKTIVQDKKLHRAKSVDIFETPSSNDFKMAFDDFEAELQHTPIVEIKGNYTEEIRDVDGFERDSSEELDVGDDDNSSRVTKILAPLKQTDISRSISPVIIEENVKGYRPTDLTIEKQEGKLLSKSQPMIEDITNSRKEDAKLTPSKLTPKRLLLPNEELTKLQSPSPPPLPKSKPPPLDTVETITMKSKELQLEELSEQVINTIRIGKPLVKTSSLRLTYTEQVNPEDVGKVNKLISRFEKPSRPLIIARHSLTHSDYSDDEEFIDNGQLMDNEREYERDVTPTNEDVNRNIKEPDKSSRIYPTINYEMTSSISDISMSSTIADINSNFSSSEYDSPKTYPSSHLGSTEATPLSERKQQQKQQNLLLNVRNNNNNHNRRSVPFDDDRFFSFDSDEENSYYSISSTNSGRYVVEL